MPFTMPDNWVEVTREAFYASVGPLEVHPVLGQQKYDPERGYTSVWRLRNGQGEAIGLSYGTGQQHYFVSPAYAPANAARILVVREN